MKEVLVVEYCARKPYGDCDTYSGTVAHTFSFLFPIYGVKFCYKKFQLTCTIVRVIMFEDLFIVY